MNTDIKDANPAKFADEVVTSLDLMTCVYYTRPSPVYEYGENIKVAAINLVKNDDYIQTFFADVSEKGEPLDLRIVDPALSDANIVIHASIAKQHLLGCIGAEKLTDDLIQKNLMRVKHLVLRSFFYQHEYTIPEKELIY